MKLVEMELDHRTGYHPQMDCQTEIVNKRLEGYLRNYVAKWLKLAEFCYDTTYNMSIGMLPFKALYDYEASTFVDLVFYSSGAPKAQEWDIEDQDIVKALKENIHNYMGTEKAIR